MQVGKQVPRKFIEVKLYSPAIDQRSVWEIIIISFLG